MEQKWALENARWLKNVYALTGDKLVIDQGQLDNTIKHRQYYAKNCFNCFAKWHCAGGCFSQDLTFNAEQRKAYCSYVKNFTRDFLVKQITKIDV